MAPRCGTKYWERNVTEGRFLLDFDVREFRNPHISTELRTVSTRKGSECASLVAVTPRESRNVPASWRLPQGIDLY